MTKSTTDIPILDAAAVAEIEFVNKGYRTDWRYPNQQARINTLCRDWRTLRREITRLTTQWCECGHAKDQHIFFSDHDECYECDQASPDLCCEWRPAPRPNENDDLQSQLEQVTRERDALRSEVLNSERYQAQMLSVPDTATSMRSACVEKVRTMGQQWYAEAKKRGAAFSDKGRLAEMIATELESVTLQEQK